MCFDSSVIEKSEKYIRQSRRVKMSQPVRLISLGLRGESVEEIGTTSNVSRDGFYFLTELEHYQEDMRLHVTLPYHLPPDRGNRDCVAQVVRVELFPDGRRSVAVRLLSS